MATEAVRILFFLFEPNLTLSNNNAFIYNHNIGIDNFSGNDNKSTSLGGVCVETPHIAVII